MKKTLYAALAVLGIAATLNLQSCGAIDSLVPAQNVNFTPTTADFVIPPTNDTTGQGSLATMSFSYDLDGYIKQQTSNALSFSNIQSIKIKSVVITLNDANQNNNFANFSTAGATFNTDASNGSYGPYNVAFIDNNPDVYNSQLQLYPTDSSQDVKKYFTSNTNFTYAVTGKLRRPITDSLHCHVDINYDITVK